MTAIPTAFQAFFPEQTSTLACTTTSGSANVVLGTVGDTLLLRNEGPSTAFLAFGNSGVTATAGGVINASSDGSFPLLAGEISTVRVDSAGSGLNVAGITAAGTATVRISRGSGV
jgi:hypothetical protein